MNAEPAPAAATVPVPSRAPADPVPFTRYQKIVIAIVSFLQFTIILDFMIISPL